MTDRPQHEAPGLFDRFAGWTARQVARAPFFAFCVLLVVVWLPSYPVVGDFEAWSLWINNPSTVLTFLLVALLQNTASRSDQATQRKLNAVADGLADLLDMMGDTDTEPADYLTHAEELRKAVGLEDRVAS